MKSIFVSTKTDQILYFADTKENTGVKISKHKSNRARLEINYFNYTLTVVF